MLILFPGYLEIPQDAPDMPDVDGAGGEETEVVLIIRCNNDIALRDLERHVDKRSPVEVRGDLLSCCQHVTGDPEQRLDLHISHQDDVAFFVEDRDGNYPVEFFYLADDPDQWHQHGRLDRIS